MAESAAQQPTVPGRQPSVRVRLARLASEAALETPGVLSLHAPRGGVLATQDGDVVLGGVVCAAEADGRFGVHLYLAVRPVPLRKLAERVRDRVEAAAAKQGLREQLGAVDVEIRDVAEPEGAAV